jgi:hypothetical protein
MDRQRGRRAVSLFLLVIYVPTNVVFGGAAATSAVAPGFGAQLASSLRRIFSGATPAPDEAFVFHSANPFLYKIVSLDEKVRVVAGEFEHCLKVQSGVSGIVGASTNEYYAPGVGRVLTTISTKGNENRVTELLSYKPGEWTLP